MGGGSGVVYGYGVLWNSSNHLSAGFGGGVNAGVDVGVGVLFADSSAVGSTPDWSVEQPTTISKMATTRVANRSDNLERLLFFIVITRQFLQCHLLFTLDALRPLFAGLH